jgi:hypothetical protein
LQTKFGGITLKGLTEGNWMELSEKEMLFIQRVTQDSSSTIHDAKSGGLEYLSHEDDEQ